VAVATGVYLQVHISYLEIYNEVGYDLLDPTREVQAMEDLPQVGGGGREAGSLTAVQPAASAQPTRCNSRQQPASGHPRLLQRQK
jgi:hypothetical protein